MSLILGAPGLHQPELCGDPHPPPPLQSGAFLHISRPNTPYTPWTDRILVFREAFSTIRGTERPPSTLRPFRSPPLPLRHCATPVSHPPPFAPRNCHAATNKQPSRIATRPDYRRSRWYTYVDAQTGKNVGSRLSISAEIHVYRDMSILG